VNVGAPRTAAGTRRQPESNQPIDHSPFPTAKSDTGRPVFFRRSGSLTGDVARDTRRHTSGVVNTLFIFPAKNTLFNPTIILSSVLIINYFFCWTRPSSLLLLSPFPQHRIERGGKASAQSSEGRTRKCDGEFAKPPRLRSLIPVPPQVAGLVRSLLPSSVLSCLESFGCSSRLPCGD
jgi:hypothetical protein